MLLELDVVLLCIPAEDRFGIPAEDRLGIPAGRQTWYTS